MLQSEIDGFEIVSDGRTVWVNGPEVMIARFAGRAWELNRGMTWETHRFDGARRVSDWIAFTRRVRDALGLEIPGRHRPVGLE